MAPATMQDVARRAGVSVKTVSNVVNDYPYIREATRERVLVAIRELDYQVNVAARNLRTGRTGIVALALPELALPYFAELADSIIRAADKHGMTVLIEQHDGSREREIEVLSGVRRNLTDGLIYSPLALSQADVGHLDVDFPLVLLGERIFHGPVDHVTMNNVDGARAATEHLLSLGRKRIAAIGHHPGEVVGSAGLRMRGYLAALKEAGIATTPELLGEAGLWHRATGAAAMAAILDSGARPDAVFAFNDALALGAMHELQVRGLRVPDDVAVIGFDNIDECLYSNPALTTVDPGREEIARTAVAMLAQRIGEGRGARAEPQQVVADYVVIARGSTSPSPGLA